MSSPKIEYSYADGSANTVRRTGVTYPDGRQVTYDYGDSGSDSDRLSRVAQVKVDDEGVAAYTYLGLGSVVQTDYPTPQARWNLITGSGADPYAALDRFGRQVDCPWQKYSSPTADLARWSYGYDRAGNRLWRQDEVARGLSQTFDELYGYDTADRLVDMQRGTLNSGHTGVTSQSLEQSWELDATGNWNEFDVDLPGTDHDLNQQRSQNAANEITDIAATTGPVWSTPTYDRAGNSTSFPQPADPTGAMTARYDAWNRVVQLKLDTDSLARYRYDGLNRRNVINDDRLSWEAFTLDQWVAFTLPQWQTFELNSQAARHLYYSDQWQVLEERVGAATTPQRQFVWGLRYIDDLILRDRFAGDDGSSSSSSGSASSERLHALQDANWNLAALIDEDAAVQQRVAYTPYGVPTFLDSGFAASTNLYDWETLFTGQRYDVASGLYLYRNRFYHAQLGRFGTRDQLEYDAGDSNLYGYTGNRPVGYVDVSGQQCISPSSLGSYISGRGDFVACGIEERSTEDDWITRTGSSANINFRWSKSSWPTDANGCCCCTKIGFVQVLLYSHTRWEYSVEEKIKPIVDQGIPLSLPGKSGQATANPCDATRSVINLGDQPNAPYASMRSHQQKFETCAVCLAGPEGPSKTDIAATGGAPPVLGTKYKTMAVYGCITWGHIIRWDYDHPGNYVYKRWMGGKTVEGGKGVSILIPHYGGLPPSPEWIEAVQKYAFNLQIGII